MHYLGIKQEKTNMLIPYPKVSGVHICNTSVAHATSTVELDLQTLSKTKEEEEELDVHT